MRKTAFVLFLLCMSFMFSLSANAKSEKEYQEEIRQLKMHNARLENKIEEVTADLKRSTVTIRTLKKEIEKMTNEAEENAREVKETRAAMKEVKNQLKTLLEQQADTGAKNTEEQLTKSIQRVQKLEKDLKKAQSEIKKQKDTITSLKKKKTKDDTGKFDKDLESLQAELEKQRKQFKATLELLQDQSEELKKAQATIQVLNKQVMSNASESSEQRVEELEAMLAGVNAKLIKMAQEKTLVESQSKELQSRRQDQTKNAEIARLEGELRKAADYINARTAEIVSLTKAKTDLESQLATMTPAKSDLESQLSAMTTAKADLESQLSAMTTAKADLEFQLSAMVTAKTGLESQLVKNSDNLGNRTREVEQLKNDFARLQTRLDEAERKNVQFTKTIADLETQLQQKLSVPDEAKKRIQELTEELQDVKVQLDTQQKLEIEYPKLQQETAVCRERLAEITKKQEGNKPLQESLQSKLEGTELAFEQARKELDAVATQNIELKNGLQKEEALRQSQEQRVSELSARNAELEQRYAKGLKELEFKEQLLQEVLTEKSLLEKNFDEGGSPYQALQLQLEQAEARNTLLRKQIAEFRKVQSQTAGTLQNSISIEAALQQQIRQEKTLRKQTEADLIEARKQVQVLNAQLVDGQNVITPSRTLPAVSGYDGLGGSIRNLFPREISQKASGGTITVLGWSADRTKIAYQESFKQKERLWIFNVQTRQLAQVTEWKSSLSTSTSLSRFAWAPDNEHFLFVTGFPRKYVLYLGNGSRLIGNPVPLRDNTVHFAWSPSRLQFAYFSGSNLIIQDVKGASQPFQLDHADAVGTSLQWSPDGTMIVFSIKRGASFDIFTLTLSEGQPLLQTLVASSSDDIHPSWSPDGKYVAFYVRSKKYDTKIAVTPVNRSRPPYVVAHNSSLSPFGGPQWLTNTEILYVGEEHMAVSQNSIYTVDIATGRRTSAPMSVLLAN